MKIDFFEATKKYEIEYIFDKLQKGEIGILAGLGSVGKSLFLVDNIIDYFYTIYKMDNLEFIEFDNVIHINSSRVLMITTEDTREAVLNRIHRKLNLMFTDLNTLNVNNFLSFLNEHFILEVTDNAEESRKIINQYNDYELLILDTLSVIAELNNENDNAEVAKKIQYFKELAKTKDIAILFVHHLSQSGFKIEDKDAISGDLIRGATTLINNSRYAAILAKVKDNIIYKTVKVNNGTQTILQMNTDFWHRGYMLEEEKDGRWSK